MLFDYSLHLVTDRGLGLVAFGGIQQDNAGAVIRAGTDGVTLVSSIGAAACRRKAAAALKKKIQAARNGE